MQEEKHHHYILHKPYGYLSQFVNNQTKRKNKKLLGELYHFADGTMAVGRLDETSEGLLLLTTDGKVSHHITSQKVEKEYFAQLDGNITDKAISQLRKSVTIRINSKPFNTKSCEVYAVNSTDHLPLEQRQVREERHGPTSWISITLTEGKFRQVRKMTAAVGFPTLRLVRVRIGAIKLNLNVGEVKEVSSF